MLFPAGVPSEAVVGAAFVDGEGDAAVDVEVLVLPHLLGTGGQDVVAGGGVAHAGGGGVGGVGLRGVGIVAGERGDPGADDSRRRDSAAEGEQAPAGEAVAVLVGALGCAGGHVRGSGA
ncbi:hypothetical protein ACUXZZ_12545 [Streptomyces graminifolii]|uniref:hypothetical protein n=1 Tax=Streptomyces graminifolii TaxID=1266771 RepID=UPI004059D07F